MTAVNVNTEHIINNESNEFLTEYIADQTTEGTSGTSGVNGTSGSSGTSGTAAGYWIETGYDTGVIVTVSTGDTSAIGDTLIILSGDTYDFNVHSATGTGQQIHFKSMASGTIRIIAQGGELIDETNIKNLTSYSAFTLVDYGAGQWILI